jgi:hypothetical protein
MATATMIASDAAASDAAIDAICAAQKMMSRGDIARSDYASATSLTAYYIQCITADRLALFSSPRAVRVFEAGW